MKFITRSAAVFNGTSKDYITKDAIKRANSRLSGNVDGYHIGLDNIYAKHSISRPTREQIANAASNAMRKLATTS